MVTRSCQSPQLCAPAKGIPQCPNINITLSTSAFPFYRRGHWPREEGACSGGGLLRRGPGLELRSPALQSRTGSDWITHLPIRTSLFFLCLYSCRYTTEQFP